MNDHRSLSQWLRWQEKLHPSEIDLGLERVEAVFNRMFSSRPHAKIITVGGTNGKGSSIAMLESICIAAGYQVGTFTSPHIFKYNERICINQKQITDQVICDSFATINALRKDISLTYFEFSTLAAFDIFFRANLDVIILEVGLGGRLDAVNIIDADVALITTIDIDHTQW